MRAKGQSGAESLLASEHRKKENPVDHDTTGLKMEDLALDSDA
jgi:hypothetical protein